MADLWSVKGDVEINTFVDDGADPTPPTIVNGGTLENCETNVYALIELNGLKWRCYITPSTAPRGIHLSQDDVIKAFGKCLQEGITCTWRRKPTTPAVSDPLQIPSFANHINKELWVFWYGNEPEKLEEHCSKLEHVSAEDFGDGTLPPITYEVRTLYFKALHTRIEQTLFKNGYIRLGRFFTMPNSSRYEAKNPICPETVLAFSFNFFIHGGNTVCVAVTGEYKPAIMKLGLRHLELKKRVKVVLSPWCLRGEVIPIDDSLDQTRLQAQQAAAFEEFKMFYTFPTEEEDEEDEYCSPPGTPPPQTYTKRVCKLYTDENGELKEGETEDVTVVPETPPEPPEPLKRELPKMVTVEIAGVRAQWPSALVGLTLANDMEAMNKPGDRNTHPSHVLEEDIVDDVHKRNAACAEEAIIDAFPQGILQSLMLPIKRNPTVPATPVGDFQAPYAAQADDDTKWNFIDPARGDKCSCPGEDHTCKEDSEPEQLEDYGEEEMEEGEEAPVQEQEEGRLSDSSASTSNESDDSLLEEDDIAEIDSSCGVYHFQHGSPDREEIEPKPLRRLRPLKLMAWSPVLQTTSGSSSCDSAEEGRFLGNFSSDEDDEKRRKNREKKLKEKARRKIKRAEEKKKKEEERKKKRVEEDKLKEIHAEKWKIEKQKWKAEKIRKRQEQEAARREQRNRVLDELTRDRPDEQETWQRLGPLAFEGPEDEEEYETSEEDTDDQSEDGRPHYVKSGGEEDEEEEIYERNFSPGTSQEEKIPIEKFTPKSCISPCNANNCEWPSVPGQELNPDDFAQIFKPGKLSTVPASASQTEKAQDWDYLYNPMMRDEPQFEPYHNRRVAEKRRASYPPALLLMDSPDQPGSQETIPATSSPPPDMFPPEIAAKLLMSRSSTFPKLPTEKSEESSLAKRRNVSRKSFSDLVDLTEEVSTHEETVPQEKEQEREQETEQYNDEDLSEDVLLTDEYGYTGCIDFEDQDCDLPTTAEVPEEQRVEPVYTGGESHEETMEVDNTVDSMLSPPASNEQYPQPLSLKATGPPSVPDANQIYPTPPSVLEANQFSPAGLPMFVGHLIVPGVPSQLVKTEDQLEAEAGTSKEMDTMEVEDMEAGTSGVEEVKEPLSVEDVYPPDWTRTMTYLSKAKGTPGIVKSARLLEQNTVAVVNRFTLGEQRAMGGDEELPMDYPKLAREISRRPQKPYLEVPLSAPQTVGSSSARINMVALDHENRTTESKTSYQISFTSMPTPLMPPQMGYSYGRPGMPNMRPGMYGMHHPGHPMGYGAMGMQQPGYMGMPPSNMGYPHMPSPMYNPMTPMNNMSNMGNMGGMSPAMGMPMSPMGGPMGHNPMGPMGMPNQMNQMNPMSQMNQMNPMNQMGQMNPMQMQMYHQRQQMQHQMMMQQPHMHSQMGPMTPMGPPMSPWDHPQTPMGPYGHQMNSPINPMTPQFGGMGHPLGPGGPVPSPMGMFGGPMTPVGHAPLQLQQNQPQLPPMCPPSPPTVTPTMSYNLTLKELSKMQLRPRTLPGAPKEPSKRFLPEKPAPEASSIVLSVILQDTILDMHYDIVFDACPMCSCNVTIRTRELGLYLSPPEVLRRVGSDITQTSGFYLQQGHMNTCNCGFSAIRHRYLSMYNGLFPEDAQEATGVGPEKAITPALTIPSDPKSQIISKYIMDSASAADRAVMNQIRIMCLKGYIGKDIHFLAKASEDMDRALAAEEDTGLPSSNSSYHMSYIDRTELLLLGNSAIDAALSPMRGPDRKDITYSTFFHPWGFQVANQIEEEPVDDEIQTILSEELKEIFEESMKVVKQVPKEDTAEVCEGPLTWTELSKKAQNSTKMLEDYVDWGPEPVPRIEVIMDKDNVRIAANTLQLWEDLRMSPIDPPKDILYLAVIPDNAEIHSQTLKYMEGLTAQYERLRFGRHVALCYDDVRDGIIRAGGKTRPSTKYHNKIFNFLDMVDKEIQDKTLIARLRLFTQQMEEAVASVLERNDCLFNREEFRRQAMLEYRAKKQAAIAQCVAAEKLHQDDPELSDSEGWWAHKNRKKEEKKEGKKKPKTPKPGDKPGTPGQPDSVPGSSSEKKVPSTLEELLNSDTTTIPPPNPPALSATVDPPLDMEEVPQDDYIAMPHVICIYVINPFSWEHETRSAINARVALIAIIRTYNAICARIKQQNRTQLMLELIGLEEVTALSGMCANLASYKGGFDNPKVMNKRSYGGRLDQDVTSWTTGDEIYNRCWNIFRAPRVGTPELCRAVQPRFMTKCGPGYELFAKLNEWLGMTPTLFFSIPSCPYQLSSPLCVTGGEEENDKTLSINQDEKTLFLNYCLVGGEYLVAAMTDHYGRMNETVVINMKPNLKANQTNFRYKAYSQIRDVMSRLMSFVQGIITTDTKPVRLVIGRLGKMGHMEFKAWTYLLGKTHLKRLSVKPKDGCKPCHDTEGAAGMPKILTACCISFEAEPFVRLFPGCFNDEVVKSNETVKRPPRHTPGSISATHIMVFTVNTTIDLSSREDLGNEHDDDNMDAFGMDLDMELGNEFDSIMDDVSNANLEGASEAPGLVSRFRSGTIDLTAFDHSTESIQNQPLATGFYVSTAPARDLPDWFWSSCPSAKRGLPVHFKASLHINTQNIGLDDEDITVTSTKQEKPKNDFLDTSSPLDSNKTDAVLRHVLESYNELSWMNIDFKNGDRYSCLPIQIQNLLRLYHSIARVYM